MTTSTDRGAEASDGTSEDEAVENSHQRPLIKGVPGQLQAFDAGPCPGCCRGGDIKKGFTLFTDSEGRRHMIIRIQHVTS